MIIESQPIWPTALLALALIGDIVMSLKPMAFIATCLSGVRLPRSWWWVLIYVKSLAVAGLIAGFWLPGVGLAATAGVIAYFIAAVIAHLRAGFTGSELWINCAGMLALSVAALVLTLVL
ncbi:DoxX family protein [Brevibacterium luteolum]|uniref:DoxX family protein n=1 Tax=Brevibacterium luteolum TaxID=199591 RepID=A0A6G8KVQ2_9MICO|nr:DoxX family protein [Brevibacterium luteolum]MBU8577879.1 hypothetical protein [Brevibacterium luteolum]QIN28726.1 hypothetical protein EW640_05130 [Brevibacterium luteolum]